MYATQFQLLKTGVDKNYFPSNCRCHQALVSNAPSKTPKMENRGYSAWVHGLLVVMGSGVDGGNFDLLIFEN